MPIYEYRCNGCGKEFEVIQKSTEGADDLACPSCGKKKPEKLVSSCCSTSSHSSEKSGGASSCGSGRFS